MNDQNTRKVFVWRGDGEDEKRLTDIIADRVAAEIINVDGYAAILRDGQPVRITKEILRDIVDRHIRTPKPVDHGTDGQRKMEIMLVPLEFPVAGSKHDSGRGPTEKTLLAMIEHLADMVTKASRAPITFQPGQVELIKSRLRTGEPAAAVAAAFHAEVEQIRSIGQAAGIHVH
jgi:hypothetical protein